MRSPYVPRKYLGEESIHMYLNITVKNLGEESISTYITVKCLGEESKCTYITVKYLGAESIPISL